MPSTIWPLWAMDKGIKCGVYAIVRVGTKECYVGASFNIRGRWNRHIQELRLGRHHSKHMQAVYNKHGPEALEFKILHIGFPRDRDLLNRVEQEWMDTLNPVYNACLVAGSMAGWKASEETKAKHSANMMGNKRAVGSQGILGIKRSAETRAKNSAARLGKPGPNKGGTMPEETKLKISLKKRGVRLSEEECLARSIRQTGVPWSLARRAAFENGKTEILK